MKQDDGSKQEFFCVLADALNPVTGGIKDGLCWHFIFTAVFPQNCGNRRNDKVDRISKAMETVMRRKHQPKSLVRSGLYPSFMKSRVGSPAGTLFPSAQQVKEGPIAPEP